MIILYTGTPGSGKSLDCAKDIYTKLRFGRDVIGNIRVNKDMLAKCPGHYFYIDSNAMNPNDFIEYALKHHVKAREGQTTIVIDECQLIFNAREWAAPHMKAWNRFFQVHRHYGYNIYLITQYDRLVDRQTRSLVQYERVHRKVSNYGIAGTLCSLFFRGGLFVCVERVYMDKMKTGSYYFCYRKKYGNFYDSYYLPEGRDVAFVNELRDYLDAEKEEPEQLEQSEQPEHLDQDEPSETDCFDLMNIDVEGWGSYDIY